MNPDFVKPRYDAGGFAGIPNRIKDAFASEKYDAVVLFLVDGFGGDSSSASRMRRSSNGS